MNPKKSANFAKVLGNRLKTEAIDANMLCTFHVLLTEEDFRIPEMDEIAEQLGAFIGSYEIMQKTGTVLSDRVQSLEYKSSVTRKLKDSLEMEYKRLGTMVGQLEKEMEVDTEEHEETRDHSTCGTGPSTEAIRFFPPGRKKNRQSSRPSPQKGPLPGLFEQYPTQ